MSAQDLRPSALALTLWLNALRTGVITRSDAFNACETVTESNHVEYGQEQMSWDVVIGLVSELSNPCLAVLPVPGDFGGVPKQVTFDMDLVIGVVAIGNDHLLYRNTARTWILCKQDHAIVPLDAGHSRRIFLEIISRATEVLSQHHFLGDRALIEAELEKHSPIHLPPHIAKRQLDAIDQATRVRVVALGALTNSFSASSPSTDRRKIEILNEIDTTARNLLSAIASA